MIDPKELLYGNLILVNGNPVKVHGVVIGDLPPIIFYNEEGTLKGIPQETADPIPLTPEWLEKCGFEKDEIYYDGETGIYMLGDVHIHHEEDQPEAPYGASLHDDGWRAFVPAELWFLHQLQNLYFALTGKELTIKL